jgi:membrane protein DedA with SNARE-associated domain
MDIHTLISSFSYVGIFILMVANGVSNFPSSQLLYVVCGYFVGTGNLLFIPTIIAGALGNTIGNVITHSLVKKYGMPLAQKLLFLNEVTLKKVHVTLHGTFSRRGIWWVLVGKLTPSVKAFVPALTGLAKTPTPITSLLFLIGSFVWAIGVTSIGYYFGEHASLKSFATVSLLIGFILFFVIYKQVSKNSSEIQ